MSYYEEDVGLGSLVAGYTFPVGQQIVAGYSVASSSPAAEKVSYLRGTMASVFRSSGTIVGAGWGGAGAPGGVPSGSVWIKVQIGTPGVTGAAVNDIFGRVGPLAQAQLATGSRVTNTHASAMPFSAPATTPPRPAATPVADPVTGLLTSVGLPAGTTPTTTTGIDPATGLPYATMLPPSENFFTQSVGGIPVWGLIAGGTVAVGAVALVLMSKPTPKPAAAAVAANRRRRSRRNRRSSR